MTWKQHLEATPKECDDMRLLINWICLSYQRIVGDMLSCGRNHLEADVEGRRRYLTQLAVTSYLKTSCDSEKCELQGTNQVCW